MRISQLFETVSSILYHYTTLYAAWKILKEKQFNLTSSAGTSTEQKKTKHFYYLSTTRSKVGDYTLHNVYSSGVTMVLDGNWFNQSYHGKAVDYWDSWWVKQREHGVNDRYRESEDRIFSNDPVISINPSEVIKEIHILYDIEKNKTSDTAGPLLRKLLIEAKKNKIPCFVYDDKDNFILQNKKKSINVSDIIDQLGGERLLDPSRKSKDWLARYRELYHKHDKENLSTEALRIVNRIVYSYAIEETVISLEADMHNSRKNNDQGLKRLLDIFSKLKIKTAKEYITLMREKWSNIIDSQ